MPLRPTSAFLNPETHLTPAESVYLEYYGVDTPSGMWSQPRSRSGYLRGAILSPYQQQGQYPVGGINNGYPPTAFFAPGTKAVHWQGALTRVQAILADSRQQIFGGPGRLPPPPPDAMLMASKVARIGIATLPNLCNAAELQRFKIAVREHLAYHLPNLRNYVERQNYCASIMGFMLGVGRLEIEQVLQNFTT